jgi:cytochrome P450
VPQASIPGPKSLLPGKWFLEFSRDPLNFFAAAHRTYGDIARFSFGRQHVILLSHPNLIEEALLNRKIGKGPATKRLLPQGLLSTEGPQHLKQRRMMQPLFHRQHVQGFAATMVRHAERWRDRVNPQAPIDMITGMRDLTLGVITETVFSSTATLQAEEVGKALAESFEHFGLAFIPGIEMIEKLPLPFFNRLRNARARLDRALDQIIADRRAATGQSDLIAMLMAARDPENPADPGMSDRQIREEAMGIFIAGHETVSGAMSWTWHLLARTPAVEARLHEELDRVLGGRAPAADDVPKLEYTRAIVAESMRVCPPAWVMGRRAFEDVTIGGHTINAGSVVGVSQWNAHHDPRWWDAPDEFRPERWMDEAGAKTQAAGYRWTAASATRPKFAYFPFGGGVHLCIGESFAWSELILFIATIAQRWRFETVTAPRPEARITLQPRGLRMRAISRSPSA